MYLLDTNVVSELRKVRGGKANAGVARWAENVASTDLFLSVMTIEEIEIGVLRVERKDCAQGAIFRRWLDQQILPVFKGRIIPVDTDVARTSATLNVPDLRPIRDGLIAGTALVHDMVVVTRNVGDFSVTGVRTVNPWV